MEDLPCSCFSRCNCHEETWIPYLNGNPGSRCIITQVYKDLDLPYHEHTRLDLSNECFIHGGFLEEHDDLFNEGEKVKQVRNPQQEREYQHSEYVRYIERAEEFAADPNHYWCKVFRSKSISNFISNVFL